MPRAFDITATTSQVQLASSGQGEVAFTVTNKLRAGVSVRASLAPTGAARSEWMSFPEGGERVLLPDGTAVIPVRITVPAGTPPGSYDFSLVVASVTNPDEDYDHGPAVAFAVAPAPVVTRKPFPWWIVALAAGVLLIGGGGVAVLLLRGGEGPGIGQPCATKAPLCGESLRCEAGTCRGAVGFKTCEKPEQCVTGRCQGGECQEQLTLGDACESPDDCRSPLTCTPQDFCLIPNGQKCSHPSQCVSGTCTDGTCAPEAARCPRCPPRHICRAGRCVPAFIVVDPHIIHDLQLPLKRSVP